MCTHLVMVMNRLKVFDSSLYCKEEGYDGEVCIGSMQIGSMHKRSSEATSRAASLHCLQAVRSPLHVI
jgi:hypothetical protein